MTQEELNQSAGEAFVRATPDLTNEERERILRSFDDLLNMQFGFFPPRTQLVLDENADRKQKIRALLNDPAATEGERAAAQAALDRLT
jgi:hypothetical protein